MNSKTINAIFSGIENGLTNKDILTSIPGAISPRTIDNYREAYNQQRVKKIREIHVTYINHNDIGLEYVYSHFPADSICRISDYSRSYKKVFFNNYHGEPVLVFDNYNSDIPVETFVNYFRNGYPLALPARGYTRTACFSEVYILSDHCPSSLYPCRQMSISPDAKFLMYFIDTFLEYDPFTKELKEGELFEN